MKHVNQADFSSTIAQGVTLVDFYADWCGPCKMIAPVLEQLDKEYTGKAQIVKLDVDANPAVGFLALANKYSTALDAGQVIAPAKNIDQMQHVIINAYTNAGLTVLFLFVVFSILFFAIKVGIAAWGSKERTDKESPYHSVPDA